MSTLIHALPNLQAELALDLRPVLRRVGPLLGSRQQNLAGRSAQSLEDQELTALRESAFPARTRMFDEEVATFLLLNPGGTVVQLGGRVHRRFLRLDNGIAHWVDLERVHPGAQTPEKFQHSGRVNHLRADLAIDQWTQQVARLPGPYCFVLGSRPGLFCGADVEIVVQALKAQFPAAWLVLDATTPNACQAINEYQLVQLLVHACHGHLEAKEQGELPRIGGIVDRSRTLLDKLELLLHSLSGWHRVLVPRFPGRYRLRFSGYQVLRVVLV